MVGSKDKKKQDETKMTVASRVVKLEGQITYLERKLDHLINVYRKDQMKVKYRTDTGNVSNQSKEEDDGAEVSNHLINVYRKDQMKVKYRTDTGNVSNQSKEEDDGAEVSNHLINVYRKDQMKVKYRTDTGNGT